MFFKNIETVLYFVKECTICESMKWQGRRSGEAGEALTSPVFELSRHAGQSDWIMKLLLLMVCVYLYAS